MAARTIADLPSMGTSLSPGLSEVARGRKPGKLEPRRSQARSTQRLRGQVSAERGRVKRRSRTVSGRAPGVDTSNILAGSKIARGEIERSQKWVDLEALRARHEAENRADARQYSPGFARALKDELEGRGVAMETVGRLAPKVAAALAPDAPDFDSGGYHVKGSDADTAGIAGLGKINGRGRRFVEDLVNFPAQAVPSLYVPAAAAVEAIGGDSSRGKKLIKELPHTDPIAALVTGHPGRALKIADEHPGFAALELYGAKGMAGRTAGRAMRSGALGAKAKAAASTERADAVGPEGTGLVQKRQYSRDVTQKAVQRVNEKRLSKRADTLRKRAIRDEDETLLAAADKLDPNRMTEKQLRRRVDARVAANEAIRRHHRAEVTVAAGRAIRNIDPAHPRKLRNAGRIAPSAATTLRVQAMTDIRSSDLGALRAQVLAERPTLTASQKRGNREFVAEIDKAIAQGLDPAKIDAAARKYAELTDPIQQGLVDRGMLAPEQIEKAKLVPYAIRNMGAVPSERGPVLLRVDEDGNTQPVPVTAAEIREHMRDHGETLNPAYVTQAPGRRGARNFFVSSHEAPSAGGATRTGAATAKGTADIHPDVLVEGAARMQGLVDAADGFAATVKEFAHKPTMGHLKKRQAAVTAARNLEAKTGERWKPIRMQPFSGRSEQLSALLARAGEGDLGEALPDGSLPLRDALESSLRGEDGPGPWALIPEAVADQIQAHLRTLGAGPKQKAAQVLTSNFRRTVLSTSPTWAMGNAVEGLFRMGISRAGPFSYLTGRMVLNRLKELDPVAAHELAVRAVGGGHYHMAEGQVIRRDSVQFRGAPVLEPVAKALSAFWRAPGPKQAAQVWQHWTDLVFRQVNGRLESSIQTAMLGRALRESPLIHEHELILGKQAVDQAARGLTNTNEQAAFADSVRRMYGRYDAFPPDTRWAIATYTPFAAWLINSWRFVTDVLPRDHPALLAMIAASELATEEWRQDHGMDLFMKEALPGFLQGSIPTEGGGHQRAPGRYVPFAAFSAGPLLSPATAVLPQANGVLSAFKGEDWKGAKIRKEDGSEGDVLDHARVAFASFVDSIVPIVGVAKRTIEKGPKALNPVAEVKPKAAKLRPASGRDNILGGGDSGGSDILSDGAPGGADTSGIFGP